MAMHYFKRGITTSVISVVLMLFISSTVSAQIEAIGTCDGVDTSYRYAISITNLDASTPYTITSNGNAVITNTTVGATYTISGLIYADGTESVEVKVIANPSTTQDTLTFTVHEVLCVDANKDGTMDFNKATCDYTVPVPNSGTIVSTVAPYSGNSVYLYILADSAGVVHNPIAHNYSGHFTNLADGMYRVSAYHFLSTAEAAGFIADLTPGSSDLDDFGSSSTPVCYNFCGSATYTVDCGCIVNIDTHPIDEEVCEDDPVIFEVAASITPPIPPSGVLLYQWQIKSGAGAFGNVSGATDSIYQIASAAVSMDNDSFRVIVTLDVSGVAICRDTSSAVALKVNGKPVFDDTVTATVCSDDEIGIVLAVTGASVAADSFRIVSIDSNGLVSSAGSPTTGVTADVNFISGHAWTNTTGAPVDVSYSISPISASGCIGDTVQIMVTITPAPSYAGPDIVTVCSGESIGVTIPTLDDNSLAMDSFVISSFVSSNLSGTATAGGTTNTSFLANDEFVNISGAPDSVKFTVTPYSGGCVGESFEIIVIVNPEPLFTTDLSTTVCSDTEIAVNLPTVDDNSLAIDSFTITAIVGDSLSGMASTGNGLTAVTYIASDVFTNTSTVLDSVIYTVTPYSGSCIGESFTIVVKIAPEPVAYDPEPMVCSDEALSITLQDLITNGLSNVAFTWYATATDSVSGETTTSSTASSITDVLTNVTGSDQVVVYTVIPTSAAGDGSCVGDTFYITVTVQSEPVGQDSDVEVCSGEALDIDLEASITNGVSLKGFLYTVSSSDAGAVAAGAARTDTTLSNITDTYTNTSSSVVTITYTVTPVSTSGCVGDAFEVEVEVRPEPILASLDTDVCSNTASGVVLAVASGSVAADSYNIVNINNNGLTATAGSPSSGTTTDVNEIADDAWENKTSASVDVVYSIIPVSEAGCVGDTFYVTLTIDPEAVVEAGSSITICSNGSVELSSLSATITGGASDGTWSSTSGTFDNAQFSTAMTFTPSTAQIDAGFAILTLTSDDPTGECGPESDTVTIYINDVRCSQFPWNGN